MKAIMVMFDSLRRDVLSCYGGAACLPNFERLAQHCVTFNRSYVGSLPCMPARRELHTGRLNMLHRSWGPIEPFDDSMPQLLDQAGIHTHIATDHFHYLQDGGAAFLERYSSWECFRGQEDDKWKGSCAPHPTEFPSHVFGTENLTGVIRGKRSKGGWQNETNRRHRNGEQDYSQTQTFDAGLEFIRENQEYDNWFLTIEPFDPHEPFDSPEVYQAGMFDPDHPFEADWPPYGTPVKESEEFVEKVRLKYLAMLKFCDKSLGRVLDAMDQYDLWKDTMLIVNTDHGFMTGEHDRWSKGFMPEYQELVNTPLFIWDPRSGRSGVHSDALVQTIDLAPTLLEYFGQPVPKDMQGLVLRETLASDAPAHDLVMFGFFGGRLNITDGRYKLMYDVRNREEQIYEYTLMPTHMAARFSIAEMQSAEMAPAFEFTKGCPVMKIIPDRIVFTDPNHGDLLVDLEKDPKEKEPDTDPVHNDPEIFDRLTAGLQRMLEENDAPVEIYTRYGFTKLQ